MDYDRLRHIFFPYTDDRTKEVRDSGRRFVYYTTAETAFRVLRNEELWMRSTSTMNDYLEVEHGFECLNAAYKSSLGKEFAQAIDSLFPGLSNEAVGMFNEWLPHIRSGTYITCFSEHLDGEDNHGRLSMWRAYGRRSGVALVINPDVMFMENAAIGLTASPVAYWNQSQVEKELGRIAQRISSNRDYVLQLGRECVKNLAFTMFRFSVLCTKHPGFEEEREWRVIAAPQMEQSPLLKASVEVVGGVPQHIQKIGFRDRPELGIVGFELRKLLNRIIIGPNEFPLAIQSALRELAVGLGAGPQDLPITISEIPLRLQA